MKAILIEDDTNLRKGFVVLLKKHAPAIQLVAQAGTTTEGYKAIALHLPEILFLDIQLTDGRSFDILEQLHQNQPNYKPKIVFITAYHEYAIRAIKFSALDYILKPIDVAELKNVLQKLEETTQTPDISQIQLLLQGLNKEKPVKKIALFSQSHTHIVAINTIIRCESDGNYTTIFIENEKSLVVSKSIKEFEELLSKEGFERVHHSHLVNVNFIKSLAKQDMLFLMTDGSQVPIATRKKELISEIINKITI